MTARPVLTELSEGLFRLANTRFVASLTVDDSTPDLFQLHTSAEAIRGYGELRELVRFRNVLQLVDDIGSAALTLLVGAPARLVVATTTAPDVTPLLEFARRRGLDDRVRVRTKVSPSDRSALDLVARDAAADAPLEVVIDGVSQSLEPGRAVFDAWFPRLEPGGSYIVERWAWEHFFLHGFMSARPPASAGDMALARSEAASAARAARGEVFEALLPSLVAVARTRPEVVASIHASKHWLEVRRGRTRLDPDGFSIEALAAGG